MSIQCKTLFHPHLHNNCCNNNNKNNNIYNQLCHSFYIFSGLVWSLVLLNRNVEANNQNTETNNFINAASKAEEKISKEMVETTSNKKN